MHRNTQSKSHVLAPGMPFSLRAGKDLEASYFPALRYESVYDMSGCSVTCECCPGTHRRHVSLLVGGD